MQYEPGTEKVAMMGGLYTPVPKPLSLAEDPQVQRTRKVLVIILGVCLALSVVNTITAISGSGFENPTGETRRGSLVGQALVSVLFYGFGLIVAHRYSAMGLRVFAWLGVIALVSMGILIILFFFLAIASLTVVSHVNEDHHKAAMIGTSVGAFVLVLIVVAAFILTVIIVKFAFKLARLITANKNVTTQPI